MDLREMTLDDLSQRLESLEKDNEQLRRENQLFDSYLKRRRYEEDSNQDALESDPDYLRRRDDLLRSDKKLSADQKFDIADKELQVLKTSIEEGRKKSETLLEKLKAILEGTDLNIAEIRKEAFDFGRFLSQSENGRTGKYDADKLYKYMEDKSKQKDNHIGKLMLKNVSLKGQIMKADQQIKHKEEMGDDLKFIDFHSLQIENKKHVKDIDDRNKKLQGLKGTKGKTDQTLSALKNKLNNAIAQQKTLIKQLDENEKSLQETKKETADIQQDVEDLGEEHSKLQGFKSQAKNLPNVGAYVEEKQKEAKLLADVKNMKRKNEIAEIAAKEAMRQRRRANKMINLS